MSGYAGVGMVGGGYQDTVDFLAHFVEHLAPVFITFGVGIVFKCFVGIFPVNITKCNDVFGVHVMQIAASHSADTDAGNVHLIAGSYMTMASA